ncbi:hypothetical protein NEUTE1DRAFT_121537 [Neurospora tetrasperma FGSC 2508]|uniref:SAP domain-containing protein n=1 Tax=Neurospora tetrasperma (strain FGSC 2508 / ATCC MYA-4615 / P0657) TaxID=510951 RepID=F8MIK2_NEUT8|nr:uncharacterized protein NEUTE1DRAFT_121537 [Neurospora tetrasperma FGSC 2508]EGO59803.1 hypothetical protein NEUTE1DRAFT_121537 [Neurospora tetrasperma FGSC 2508]EGZ73951.1 hypothetical protein NEUTE2DRAFT_109073 [Neurospora tetrasperma FGSC 2509]
MSCIIDADWLPDDFPWDEFTWLSKDDLKKQCAKRYLPVSGTKSVLRQRLLDYQRTHTTERHFLQDSPCLHVEYLLRKVFNTPELLLWQEAYLTSELEYIYKKSHAALSRLKPDRYRQGKQCVICFAVHKTHELNVPCSLCGLPTHPFCLKALRKKRTCDPAQASQCLLCLDKTALAVEKYFGRSQVSLAVAIPVPIPASPASIRAPAGSDRSITGAIQSEAVSPDSIERRTTLQEPHSAAQQRCTSTPLPGVPALIWQEMHQQAREQQEQKQQQQQEQSEQRQRQDEQRQRQDEQKYKQQKQQQQAQAKVRAIRPVITEVRVSELPGPARVEVSSRAAAKQTPIAKKLVFEDLWASPAASAAGSGAHSSIQSSPPPISTATQADESAVNPPGNSRGRSTDAPEVAGFANEQANNADVPGSALVGANTIITATLDNTNNNKDNNTTDRKAAKLARSLKRLEAKLEHLEREADYYYTEAERKDRKIERVEKKIWKIKEKAEKRALARGGD